MTSVAYSFSMMMKRSMPIDGFQISIKCPTCGGQTHNQEAAVQQTFHFKRSSFFYLSALMVRTQPSFLASILHIAAPNTHPDSCPPEVKPHPIKTICSSLMKAYTTLLHIADSSETTGSVLKGAP